MSMPKLLAKIGNGLYLAGAISMSSGFPVMAYSFIIPAALSLFVYGELINERGFRLQSFFLLNAVYGFYTWS